MALQKDFTHAPTGAHYPEAYIVIEDGLDVVKRILRECRVAIYVSAAAKAAGKSAVEQNPLNLPDPQVLALIEQFKQAIYQLIKLDPYYDGSIDVP